MTEKIYTCRIQISSDQGTRFEETDKATFTIGRGIDADIKIPAPDVGRLHLAVRIKDGALWLEDLGSANGTIVNNQKLQSKTPVQYKNGQIVKLGVHAEMLQFTLTEKGKTEPQPALPVTEVSEKTMVDPEFQKISMNNAIKEAEAKAAATKAKADAEALRFAKEAAAIKAMEEVLKAKKQGEEIIKKAQDLAEKISKEVTAEGEELKHKVHKHAEMLYAEAEKGAQAFKEAAVERGESIWKNHQIKAEKFLSESRVAASAIKTEAQKEAEEILNQAYQKSVEVKEKAEVNFKAALVDAKKKAGSLISEAEAEAEQIVNEARTASSSIRQNIEKDFAEIKSKAQGDAALVLLDAQKEAEKIAQNSQAEASKMIAAHKESLKKERAEMLVEVENFKREAERHKSALIKEGREEVEKIKESIASDIAAGEKKKKEIAKKLEALEESHDKLNDKLKQIDIDFQSAKSQADAKLADINAHIISTQTFLDGKKNEVSKAEHEVRRIAAEAANADQRIANVEKERDQVRAAIQDLRNQEQVQKDGLTTYTSQLEAEKQRRREEVDREILAYKSEREQEYKRYQDQIQVELLKDQEEKKAEISRLHMREIENVKEMRLKEEARLVAARKNHVMELSRNLEMLILPRIKDANKGTVPPTFANLFPELSEMVSRVMTQEYAGPHGDTNLGSVLTPAGGFTKMLKSRNASLFGLTLAAFILIGIYFTNNYNTGEESMRKPASEVYMDHLREQQEKKPKFNPVLTDNYKESYTDNVLYTKDYVSFKQNADLQKKWIKDLNRFFVDDLSLGENAIVKFVSRETSLVGQLTELRAVVHLENQKEDIKKMTDLEAETVNEMKVIVGGEKNYLAFRNFEKNYFLKLKDQRTTASDPSSSASSSEGSGKSP